MTGSGKDDETRPFDVAIIGMSGRFPGADGIDELWQLLAEGREGVTHFSEQELLSNGVDPMQLADPNYVRISPVLNDIDKFDAGFFGISPLEASALDPQQRLFLEHSWHALEDAGHDPRRFDGLIGVVAGTGLSSYMFHCLAQPGFLARVGQLQLGLGNDKDSLSTRTAYHLDLKGPCFTVQSYCSTSLVSICTAATSLVQGEADMALAGGVVINVPHQVGYQYQEGGLSSSDGRCRAFDADAEGTPVGSGVGVVVLRRLADAIEDGDRIHAVIRGWAVNNDGASRVGFTAPGVRGQAAVVAEAISMADVDIDTIDYIEAHGSGTALGDAVEIASLQKVFGPDGRCAIGSVKSNVGHLDRASGVTGLFKVTMALKHNLIPKTLHFTKPNPQLLEQETLEVVSSHRDWPRGDHPRRAGVSSFGMGGTNAHVVVEEAPEPRPRLKSPRRQHVIAFSAQTPEARDALGDALASQLAQCGDDELGDLGFTLQSGRGEFPLRAAMVCSSAVEGRETLAGRGAQLLTSAGEAQPGRPVGFLIAGVGEQYPGLVGHLYRTEPTFRRHIDDARERLRALTGEDPVADLVAERPSKSGQGKIDLRAMLAKGKSTGPTAQASGLVDTEVIQPALFVVYHALARTLIDWGVEPAIMFGYSLGEYVAATLAGVMSFDDALALVAHRARLIEQMPHGSMAAVGLAEADAIGWIRETGLSVDVAGVNGPSVTVLSGPIRDMSGLLEALEAEEVPCRRLDTSHAFHSRVLADCSDSLTNWVRDNVALHAPRIPYLSNVTGQLMTESDALDPSYWSRHMRSPVRFADAAAVMLAESETALLELGPGPSLGAMLRGIPGCDPSRWASIIPSLPAHFDPRPDDATFAEALARLWLSGVSIDWSALNEGHNLRRIGAPLYPFARNRHWVEAEVEQGAFVDTDEPSLSSLSWMPMPTSSERELGGTVVVFADERGVGQALASDLRGAGVDVRIVRRGPMNRSESSIDTVCETSADQHLELVESLVADQSVTIVHLWALDAVDALEARRLAFESLVYLGRSLGESSISSPRLIAVSIGAEAVLDTDLPSPEATLGVGPALVAGQEYPTLSSVRVDLEEGGGEQWVASCACALSQEIAVSSDDAVTAWRGNVRYGRFFEGAPASSRGATIRSGGVYLVTGGLGYVGLELSRHLAAKEAGAIILTTRGDVPERSQWMASGSGEPGSRAAALPFLAEIDPRAEQIYVESADATDPGQMRGLVASIRQRFGRLDGVFHLASGSLEGFSLLSGLTPRVAEEHLAAKLDGALVLEEVLAEEPVEFCVLFSSISTILGGLGFASYVSANAALQAVAHRNRRRGRHWLAINWDTWAPSLQLLADHQAGATQLDHSLEPALALGLLDEALASVRTDLVASAGNLDARLREWFGRGGVEVPVSLYPRPELPQEYVPPASEGEERLARLWSETIGVEPVGTHDNFFDLGGTSLTALQLIRRIKEEFGVALPAVALFEMPTIVLLTPALGEVRTSEPSQPADASPSIHSADPSTISSPLPMTASEEDTHAGISFDDEVPVPAPSGRATGVASASGSEVAIIGMAGRFPGARSVDELWQNLVEGVESIKFFGDQELEAAGVAKEIRAHPDFVAARPVLDDIRGFDAPLFGYSPKEASLTGPQHRIFLECCWEALESSGYGAADGRGKVGVFAGVNMSSYLMSGVGELFQSGEINDFQVVIGSDKDALATMASYRMNLTGPSLSVLTFCSTSLVATHLARQSLRGGECDIALAGGVSIRVPDVGGHIFEEGGMASPDGHVRTFDAAAKGSMFGDGCAVLVLKTLADARRDGDTVYAVIRGSAVNNDGSQKAGYTTPSVVGQAEVIRDALADADVSPEQVSFVEAHGTATELGDPIEVAALIRAFDTTRRQYCALGSIKPNVGHLDRAAGATGLIKTALSLHHGVLPASLNFETPNPEIDFKNSPFFVNTSLRKLEASDGVAPIGSVSSLGMGGTNAHVVLQKAPDPLPRPDSLRLARRQFILPLSARTCLAADTACARLGDFLSTPGLDPRDVAWTLQMGRENFSHRRVVVADSLSEAAQALNGADGSKRVGGSNPARHRRVRFVFGSDDYPSGCLQQLVAREPVVAAVLADLRTVAIELSGEDVVGWLATPGMSRGDRTTQALATFIVQWTLVELLRSWGVSAESSEGKGIGTIVADCVEKRISMVDGLHRVAALAGDPAAATPGTTRPMAAKGSTYVSSLAFGSEAASWLMGRSGEATLVELALDRVDPGKDDAEVAWAIAGLWITGVDIEWDLLMRDVAAGEPWQPRRIQLPTYPFERAEHWIQKETPAMNAMDRIAAESETIFRGIPKLPVEEWLHLPVWHQRTPGSRRQEGPHVLAFSDAGADEARLLSELSSGVGASSLTVIGAGESFAFLEAGYSIRPGSSEDIRLVLEGLGAERRPDLIVHLWGAGTCRGLCEEKARGFDTLIALTRELGELGHTHWDLEIVSTGCTAVFEHEKVVPSRALLTGPLRVIPLEYPDVRMRLVDVGPGIDMAVLARELGSEPRDRLIALRGNQQWAQSFDPIHSDRVAEEQGESHFVNGGVYVVTGGLGGIGLAMAERLARDHAAQLVLMGRLLPPKDQWDELCGRETLDEDLRRRIEGARRILAYGGELFIVPGDLGVPEDVDALLQATHELFGRINGVIHAAGAPGIGLMQFKEFADFDGVLDPKVAGTLAIEKAVAQYDIALLVLFSSVTSITGGGPGQVDYCAANAFLDAYARDAQDRQVARRVISIGWGEWVWNAWGAGLAGYDPKLREFFMDHRAEFGIDFEDGWQSISNAIATGESHVIVSTQDFAKLAGLSDQFNIDVVRLDDGDSGTSQRHPRPELARDYVPASTETEVMLAELWADFLGFEELGINDDFFELGGNSLLGIDLIGRVRVAFELDHLPPRILYEAPTVALLAACLADAGMVVSSYLREGESAVA